MGVRHTDITVDNNVPAACSLARDFPTTRASRAPAFSFSAHSTCKRKIIPQIRAISITRTTNPATTGLTSTKALANKLRTGGPADITIDFLTHQLLQMRWLGH